MFGAAACATAGPPPAHGPAQQQVDAAQTESEGAYERAVKAQHDASAKSAEATRAEDEAQAKQADAQRAGSRARALRAQAEEAQRRAIEEGQEAGQQAQRAQHRALLAQPGAQAQAQANGASTSAKGTVQTSSANELVIDRDNAPSLRLKVVDHETTITNDGQAMTPQDLLPGTPVTVTYRIERDQPVAQMIEAGAAAQLSSPESSGH
jgi:hypothetical protein